MNIGWIIFVAVYVLVDLYSFQALKTVTSSKWVYGVYFLVSLVVLIGFMYCLLSMGESRAMTPLRMYSFGSFIALFFPKLLLIVVIMFGQANLTDSSIFQEKLLQWIKVFCGSNKAKEHLA